MVPSATTNPGWIPWVPHAFPLARLWPEERGHKAGPNESCLRPFCSGATIFSDRAWGKSMGKITPISNLNGNGRDAARLGSLQPSPWANAALLLVSVLVALFLIEGGYRL